jgi:AraC-like DNA-binding protein
MRNAPDDSACYEEGVFSKTVDFKDIPTSVFTHIIPGAELEHRKVPGGDFRVDLLRCNLPNSILCQTFYQPAILVNGTFAKKVVTLGTMSFQRAPTIVNGSPIRTRTLQFCSENSEITYRAWPDASWFVFVISRETLTRFLAEHLEVALDLPSEGIVTIDPLAKEKVLSFSENLHGLSHSLRVIDSVNVKRHGELIENEILTAIAQSLCANPLANRTNDRHRLRKCWEIFNDTTKRTMRDPDEVLDIHSMSQSTGLSIRTIQRAFQAEFGLSSVEWMRVERLHRVRAEFLNEETSVMKTATRWGFVHLGRFSRYYRELFGESPSVTLSRRAAIQDNVKKIRFTR